MKNKYSDLFDESMSSRQADYILVNASVGLSESEMEELLDAHHAVITVIRKREIDDTMKNGIIH